MKSIQHITALGISLLMFAACESDLEKMTFDSATAIPATLSVAGSVQDLYTLDPNKGNQDVFTINWTQPEMGYQASVTNILQMDLEGKSFAYAQELRATNENTELSYTATTSDFNSQIQTLLNNYSMETQQVTLEFRLASVISSAADTVFSEVLKLNVLPYEGEAVYPSISVMGAYNNWNFKDQKIYSVQSDNNYAGMIYFNGKAQDGWKFSGAADWSVDNWGAGSDMPAEAGTVTLSAGGGNIVTYSKNSYYVEFDNSTGVLKMTQGYMFWGVVGAHNGWGEGDTKMTLSSDNEGIFLTATLEMDGANTWKIRPDEKWENDKGPGNLAYEGDVKDNGDGNFGVTQGTGSYEIKWYFNKAEQYITVYKK